MSADTEDAVRLDIWLWRARFFKTRALATDYISRKGVRLTRTGQTRKITKPGARLARGDVLAFYRGTQMQCVEIIEFGERRGPASEAQALYSLHAMDT